MKILLADDHRLFVEGITEIIRKNENWQKVELLKAYTFEQANHQLKDEKIDLLICDINLSDRSGLDLIPIAKSLRPKIKILMLSIYNQPEIVKRAMTMGANGYLIKDTESEELIKALEIILQGGSYLTPSVALAVRNYNHLEEEETLTAREREILNLIIREMSNTEIADKLFISARTVETHRKNIFRKTKNHTVVGLVKYAYKMGIISE